MHEETPAQQQLRAHHEAGRLSDAEYQRRGAVAAYATSDAQLDELFRDLPGGYQRAAQQWPTLGGTPFEHQQLAVQDPPPAGATAWRQPPARSAPEGPATLPAHAPAGAWSRRRIADLIAGLSWPVSLVLFFVTGDWRWMLLAIFITPVVVKFLRN